MRWRFVVLALLVLVAALPLVAQETGNTVAFNGFSFTFDPALASNVDISQITGGADTFPPEAPHTQFLLYGAAPAPQNTWEAVAAVKVYRTADLAGNAEYETAYQQLQTLLAERPDPAQLMTVSENLNDTALPFLPAIAAGQVLRARVQYVDTPTVQGVSYMSVYRQDVSPFTGGEFFYTFQGLSLDGAYYISAVLNFDTSLFPAEPEEFDPTIFNATEYYNQSIAQLNAAGTEAFTPALASLDALVQTFAWAGNSGPIVATPEATATLENTDATLGGLAGMWNLVSYGSAETPIAVLANAPITLTISAEGISGSGGCNTYSGSFQYNANRLMFAEVVSTLMACDQPILDQETAYLEALRTASSFQITDGQLQITYAGGVLTFTAAQ